MNPILIVVLGALGLLFLVLRKGGASLVPPDTGKQTRPRTPQPGDADFVGPMREAPTPGEPAFVGPVDVQTMINVISQEVGFDHPEVAFAIAQVESALNARAVNPSDPSYGLMGLQLPTARAYNPAVQRPEDLFDPENNIRAGVGFLLDLENKYADREGWEGIIQMYNLGETRYHAGLRSPQYLERVKARL